MFNSQEPRNPKRKLWLAGTEVVEEEEEPPPASGDQEEVQQEVVELAGEPLQPRPLKLLEDGATLQVASSLPDLHSGTRTRVLPWEGDLTTVGPVSGEPNLSQECPDLPEVSNSVTAVLSDDTLSDPALPRDVSSLLPGDSRPGSALLARPGSLSADLSQAAQSALQALAILSQLYH